jgi:hypothetical protein
MIDLLIATPTHGGQVTTHYAESLSRLLIEVGGRQDFKIRHAFIDSALVGWARNAFATAVLVRPAVTHVLFVDSDIGFSPSAVLRMLDFDKPFVGCLCPVRRLDHHRFHKLARAVDDPERARRAALNFVMSARVARSGADREPPSFARAEALGMGLTLIRRDVLERLSAAHPELWAPADRGYIEMGVQGRVFQPFRAYHDESGLDLSEDLSFARRWTELGGEIWACLDEEVTHVGAAAFTGSFADRLRSERTPD